MPFADVRDSRIYYELQGPDWRPTILQFGGTVLGRRHFDGARQHFELDFRILSFDPSGYGRSEQPVELYTVEGWAEEATGLLDALGVERVLVHGSSGGGMIALAFTGLYPERTIAAVADCCLARPDVQRRMLFRVWRKMAEAMPLDDWADLLTAQAMSPTVLESAPKAFEDMRVLAAQTSPYTLRKALLAQELMDLETLARGITRPILFTHMRGDVLCPADLGPSGFGTRQIVEAIPEHARLLEFEGLGHAPLVEVPAQATRAVVEFFREALARESSFVARATAETNGRFDVAEFTDELREASTNPWLGRAIWFENERVRIWDASLPAAYRQPFHAHAAATMTIHTDDGSSLERSADGDVARRELRRGEVEFAPASAVVHDLENAGQNVLRSVVVELLDGPSAPLGGPAVPTAPPALATFPYDRDEYGEELDRAQQNRNIGDETWFENDRARVWSIGIEPGGRVPFHCHATTYFWVCIDGGLGQQRLPDGHIHQFVFRRGDVDFLEIDPSQPLVHDLENIGDTTLRFLAVELLDAH